ncbi:MAG TPA: threonine--tRNA ligase [Thermomicrobiales bacterium]|nr:threonine--tRNA ligase [Thermomicrobiales bacterium]
MAQTEPKVVEELDELDVDVSSDEEYELARMRHSAAHVMATAVRDIFPDARFAIGPAIEDGFYYDFELPRSLTPDDLEDIEARMREHIEAREEFVRREVSREEALEIFKDQPYKLELINELPEGEVISTYQNGPFLDLCRGPHVEDTSKIGAVKLLSIAGAYWRGDENRPMLQRIYGTAWRSQEELEDYLERREEALRRDHRRLGRELDYFSVDEEIGPGLILWHPKGAIVRHLVERFETDEQLKRGYQLVYTPHIGSEALYQTSGHLENYGENMYAPMDIDGLNYYLKPMNCPGHIKIYNSTIRSYRDLPIRYAELGTVYRYERSGALHGMLRVRGFTQDDAHIFCLPEQLVDEVKGVLDLALYFADVFGYEYQIYISTRPEKSIGSDENWERATTALMQAVDEMGLKYEIDPGEGTFYGPKIDIKLLDSLGRGWQGPTIQCDFNLPERFDVNYIGEDGERHRAVMIHRTVLGSMERFVGGLIEHYGGAFPVWLAPVQAVIIPIADRHIEYAEQVEAQLGDAGMRVEVDRSSARMQHKIREAQLQKIPYMLVVGDREGEGGAVSVRLRTEENLGSMPVAEFLAMARAVIDSKSLELQVS